MTNDRPTKDRDRILIFHVPRDEMVKIRRMVHGQEWYTGADVPLDPARRVIYGGIPVGHVIEKVRWLFKTIAELSVDTRRDPMTDRQEAQRRRESREARAKRRREEELAGLSDDLRELDWSMPGDKKEADA